MKENNNPELRPESIQSLDELRKFIVVSPEVKTALKNNKPVIALDTTIFGQAGLGSSWPSPQEHMGAPNELALESVLKKLKEGNVVPALTAVMEGSLRIGIDVADYKKFLGTEKKAGTNALQKALEANNIATTTISSALWLAEQAGIKVLATSGIGGIHVDHSDRSPDLDALAQYSVITVSAGMKTFLDREATINELTRLGVPVLGWQTDDCPAFYAQKTGIPIRRVDTAEEIIAVAKEKWDHGQPGGILVAVPISSAFDMPLEKLQAVMDEANADVASRGITDSSVTPEVLKYMRTKMGNRLVESNLALARENARIATLIANKLSR